jgi:hypothetical protein
VGGELVDSIKIRGIDVFYQLRYFLSLNTRNAYIRREYISTYVPHTTRPPPLLNQ